MYIDKRNTKKSKAAQFKQAWVSRVLRVYVDSCRIQHPLSMHARKTNSASIRIPAVSGVCIYLANNFRRLYVVCHELGMFSMCISYWYPVLFFKYYNTMSGVYLNLLVTAVVPRAYYGFYMYNTWYQVYTKHTLVYTIYYTRIYIVYHGIYHV